MTLKIKISCLSQSVVYLMTPDYPLHSLSTEIATFVDRLGQLSVSSVYKQQLQVGGRAAQPAALRQPECILPLCSQGPAT